MSNEEKPAILVDVYGTQNVPDAARFGVGITTKEGAQAAQDARRNAKAGQYRDSK